MLFFDVAFFIIIPIWVSILGGFGVRNGSQNRRLGPVWAPKYRGASPFEAFETPWLSKMVSWRAPRSIFKHPGVDLGRFRLHFFKIWHRFWACFLTFSHHIFNFHFLADHCFSNFDFPDVRPWSKQCLNSEQSNFSYFLCGKVYRALKLCQTLPFIVVLRSPIGLGGIAKRKQFSQEF